MRRIFSGRQQEQLERITRSPRILIYESEACRIAKYARSSPSLEIGGDLLGFYEPGGSPLVFVASGPGPAAQRDATHFQQDPRFQVEVFNKVASRFRMFYVGDWHSHHTLGLSEPSGSDDAKLRDLAEKNGWPILFSLIVQTRAPEHRTHRDSHSGISEENELGGPIQSFGVWWNAFRYNFGDLGHPRRRVCIDFQRGANPYLAMSEEVNAICEDVCNRWSRETAGFGRFGAYPEAEQSEMQSENVNDEFALGVYQKVCGVITQKLQRAEMEVDLVGGNGARLLVSEGVSQVVCTVVRKVDEIELTISGVAESHKSRLPCRRGRVASSDIDVIANQIIALLNPSVPA